MIGYSVDPSFEDFELAMKQRLTPMPYSAKYLDSDQTREELLAQLQELGVDWPGALPLIVLFDADGTVLMRFTGSSGMVNLQSRISSLL